MPKSTPITIISAYYPPERGAAAGRVAQMAKELANTGLLVEVLTGLPNYPLGRVFSEYRGKILALEELEGIKVRRHMLYPSNSRNAIKRLLSMTSLSASLILSLPHLFIRRPRIVIVNSPPLLTGFAGVLLARLIKARIILNVSDLWPLSALELGAMRAGRTYRMLSRIEDWMYQLSDAILCQSREIETHISKRVPQTPTLVYRNLKQAGSTTAKSGQTADKNIAAEPDISAHQKHRSPQAKIVYAGLLGVAQNLLGICEAINFAELGAELHIYGTGPEQLEIERFIAEHPQRSIFYHGSKTPTEIQTLLKQYDATLIPLKTRIYGAFPSKVYEAVALGIPMLVASDGEAAQFVEHYQLGWASAAGDMPALERNIELLYQASSETIEEIKNNCNWVNRTELNYLNQQQRMINFVLGEQ